LIARGSGRAWYVVGSVILLLGQAGDTRERRAQKLGARCCAEVDAVVSERCWCWLWSSLLLGVRSGRVGFMALRPAGVVRAGLSQAMEGGVLVVVWSSVR
jgi:hypothetical protein